MVILRELIPGREETFIPVSYAVYYEGGKVNVGLQEWVGDFYWTKGTHESLEAAQAWVRVNVQHRKRGRPYNHPKIRDWEKMIHTPPERENELAVPLQMFS